MKQTKKLISWFITLCMLCAALPISVSAADGEISTAAELKYSHSPRKRQDDFGDRNRT